MPTGPLVGSIHQHHPDLTDPGVMPLGATMDDLQRMQQFVNQQHAMGGPGMMVGNGDLQAMMDQAAMMPMLNMEGVGNGMSLDPQLCSGGGDRFGGLVATAPIGGVPGEYGGMSGGGSILTEFTKRRNWSQRILDELQDFLHILDPDRRIMYVSPSCEALTGFTEKELVGQFVDQFIHEDDQAL